MKGALGINNSGRRGRKREVEVQYKPNNRLGQAYQEL